MRSFLFPVRRRHHKTNKQRRAVLFLGGKVSGKGSNEQINNTYKKMCTKTTVKQNRTARNPCVETKLIGEFNAESLF